MTEQLDLLLQSQLFSRQILLLRYCREIHDTIDLGKSGINITHGENSDRSRNRLVGINLRVAFLEQRIDDGNIVDLEPVGQPLHGEVVLEVQHRVEDRSIVFVRESRRVDLLRYFGGTMCIAQHGANELTLGGDHTAIVVAPAITPANCGKRIGVSRRSGAGLEVPIEFGEISASGTLMVASAASLAGFMA